MARLEDSGELAFDTILDPVLPTLARADLLSRHRKCRSRAHKPDEPSRSDHRRTH